MLESKLVEFLTSVLKWQINSSSNFALVFIVMTNNFSANFNVMPLLLCTKRPHQSPNFNTIKCSGENLPISSSLFSNHKSFFLQNLHISSVSWQITRLYFCSSNNIDFGQRSQLKHKVFRLSSARVKIYQVPHANFKTKSQFLFNFCIILHWHDT